MCMERPGSIILSHKWIGLVWKRAGVGERDKGREVSLCSMQSTAAESLRNYCGCCHKYRTVQGTVRVCV